MDYATTDRTETIEEFDGAATARGASAGAEALLPDPRAEIRLQDEKDVFLSFGAFPLRNAITMLGLVAMGGGMMALPVMAYLAL